MRSAGTSSAFRPPTSAYLPTDSFRGAGSMRARRRWRSEVFAAAVNVGTRPTFDGRGTTIEAHLLDYTGDLYGRFLTIAFMVRLREEVRFDGLDDLIRQIHRDVERVREVLN